MRQPLKLGSYRTVDGLRPSKNDTALHHLVTHGVVVGMTGSGKTGLLTVMVEEALRAAVPVLMIDVKGDLPNLMLALPSFDATALEPWISTGMKADDERPLHEVAAAAALEREQQLRTWEIDERTLQNYREKTHFRMITPGSTSGEPLHVLSSLERENSRWAEDPESARASLSASVSLLLRLLGLDADPAKSKEHVLISILAERRLAKGETAELQHLLNDLLNPPIEQVGAMPLDEFLPKAERRELAASLNTLLASPTFATWRQGSTLNVASWMEKIDGKTPATIVSVAHLDDDERALVLGVVLEELLSWVRSLSGSQALRALIVFDEVYGFIPPHPQNPPTKRPIVALMKQARAFGVGVLLATQNPMDLDYRALSNAGLWCIGRLQTDADRHRVIDGLCGSDGSVKKEAKELSNIVKKLSSRWFLVRNVHSDEGLKLLQPRWAMSFLKGPMTRNEIRAARMTNSNPAPLPKTDLAAGPTLNSRGLQT